MLKQPEALKLKWTAAFYLHGYSSYVHMYIFIMVMGLNPGKHICMKFCQQSKRSFGYKYIENFLRVSKGPSINFVTLEREGGENPKR